MMENETGINNLAIGAQALFNNNASDNIAIGSNAMGACDQGSHASADIDGNIAIGTNALLGGDFGSSNKNTTENVAIGYNAMDGTGTIGANYNIFIGKDSGGGSWTTGECNFNVGIGHSVMTLPV